MEITESKAGATLVIALSGRLDSTTTGPLERLVLERLGAGVNRLAFDFSDLHFISSAGLRVLAMTLRQLSAAEGRMTLCGLRQPVQTVFDISGFNSYFTIADTLDEALAALA